MNTRMDYRQKALLMDQMVMILEAGINLSDGLSESYPEAAERLASGLSLSEALSGLPIGDKQMVTLIKVGEESGYLVECLKQLSLYYQRLADIKAKLKEALTYPILLVVLMMVVIAILITKVLPIFENVLGNIGVTISPLAKTLMNSGRLLALCGGVVLVLAMSLGVISYLSIVGGKPLASKLPFVSGIAKKLSLALFAFEMSLFSSAGRDINESLKLAHDSCSNEEIKVKISRLLNMSEEGQELSKGILETKLFSSLYDQLLSVGFRSGKATEALNRIAEEYEKEADSDINRYLDIVEPIIIGVLCLVVGAILLSVMLPLMSIMSSL